MTERLTLPQLLQDTLQGAKSVAVPTVPWAALFVFGFAYLSWSARALPSGGLYDGLFVLILLVVLYAHSLFSAAMYREILPLEGTLRSNAFKLTLATLLLFVATAIIVFILTLFFSIFSVVLVAITGYDPTVGEASDVRGSIAALQESGAIWVLGALLVAALAGLFWYAVRIMTFAAATVSRNQIHVFRTWGWTHHHVAVLAPAMSIAIVLPIVVLGGLGEWLLSALGWSSGFQQGAAAADLFAESTGLAAAVRMVILIPSAWLGHGLAASVYKQLAVTDPDTSKDDSLGK